MSLRIAYACADPGVPVFGTKGCSIHVQEVIRALLRRGHHVELFATRVDGDVPRGLERVTLHRLPPSPKGDLAQRERGCLAANAALRAMLDAAGKFDFLYERYSLWSYAAMRWAAEHGVPRTLEVNAPLIDEQADHRGLVDRAGAERVAEEVFTAATSIVCVSDDLVAWLDRYPQARGKARAVPNGVDPRRFTPDVEPALARQPGTFTVGFVGTLKPWHGIEGLIDVFAHLHRRDDTWRLLVVGDGPMREQLEEDAARRNLSAAARFAGAVSPERIPAILASMDVAVAPYPRLDAFYFSPMKLYEYMAARLPVVASRIGQIEQVIEHSVTGVLCEPGDVGGWVRALDELRRDGALCRQLGRAARTAVVADHSWDSVVRRILLLAGVEDGADATALPIDAEEVAA